MYLTLVTIHAFPSPQAVPLAAACLEASLDSISNTSRPVFVNRIDLFHGDSLDSACHAIVAMNPDLVGFSLYAWNREEAGVLAGMLRREKPSLVIFAGGPEVSADPAGVLADSAFDFLVVGEGEVTICEVAARLADGADLNGVTGIAWRTSFGIDLAGRLPVADLDALPSPILSGKLDASIAGGVLWQLSRGCPFGCEFCFDGMGDRVVRRFSAARLEAELDYLVRHGAGQVVVLDSTFNVDGERAKALLRMMRRKAPLVHFHFEARAELLDAEQARLFGGMRCSLQIGLQTADPGVSRAVGRSLDRRLFAKKVALLNREGVVFGFDLIYGLPGDSLERFRETLDFALDLYPNSLAVFPLAVLPGTVLAERADMLNLRHVPSPPYTILSSPTFPAEDLQAARRLADACDIFYSRGRAVAWFNGVRAALRMTAAAFLEVFAEWLERRDGAGRTERDYGDEEIHVMQREFLAEMFARRKAQRLLALALDFVDYHNHYAAVLMAVPPRLLSRRQVDRIDVLRRPLAVAESTRLAAFSYEILDLLEAGEPDLPNLCGALSPSGSYAVIYPHCGEVCTESLAEPYFRLLERLDGKTPARDIAVDLGLSFGEARDFLAFAAAEGIVCIC